MILTIFWHTDRSPVRDVHAKRNMICMFPSNSRKYIIINVAVFLTKYYHENVCINTPVLGTGTPGSVCGIGHTTHSWNSFQRIRVMVRCLVASNRYLIQYWPIARDTKFICIDSTRHQSLKRFWNMIWRNQMDTFSALLVLCAGNSPVTGEFPSQRPVTRSFDVFFDLRLKKRLTKQSWGWWFETPSRS